MDENITDNNIKIIVMKNGPARIECGEALITLTNGEKVTKHKNVFICRCGITKHQPFCDGAHKACKFEK